MFIARLDGNGNRLELEDSDNAVCEIIARDVDGRLTLDVQVIEGHTMEIDIVAGSLGIQAVGDRVLQFSSGGGSGRCPSRIGISSADAVVIVAATQKG